MINRAKIVNINVSEGGAGLVHATSPEVKDLFVSGRSEAEVMEAVPSVLTAIFSAYGRPVTVVKAEANNPESPAPWVILSDTDFAEAV